MVAVLKNPRPPLYGPWNLTPAEVRALDGLCIYANNAEAARAAGVRPRTIEHQLQGAYYKMNAHRMGGSARVHAMRLWLAHHGVIDVG